MGVSVRFWLNVERIAGIARRVDLPDDHVGRIPEVYFQGLAVWQLNGENLTRAKCDRRARIRAVHCQELGKFAGVSVSQSSDSASLVATHAFT